MIPLVLGLRRFALDDGPGIRTTLFLRLDEEARAAQWFAGRAARPVTGGSP